MKHANISSFARSHRTMLLLGVGNALFLSLVFGLLLLRPQFSPDCFDGINNGYESGIEFCLQHGRWTGALLRVMLQALGVNVVLWQSFCYAFWIIGAAAALTLVTRSYSRIAGFESASSVVSINMILMLAYVNAFCTHLLLWPDIALDYALGLFFVACSASFLLSSVAQQEPKKRIFRIACAFLFLLAALGFYQGLMGMFVALCVFGLVIHQICGCSIRRGVLYLALVLLLAGLATVSILASPQLFVAIGLTPRFEAGYLNATLSISTVVGNAESIAGLLPTIFFEGLRLTPPLLMTGFLICLIIVSIIVMARQPMGIIMIFMGATLVSLLAVFAPHAINSSLWITARSLLSLWSIYAGVGCVLYVALLHKGGSFGNRGSRVILMLFAAMVFMGSFFCRDLIYESTAMSQKDITEGAQIADAIELYEKTHGVQIDSVGFCTDANVSYVSEGARYISPDTLIRPLSTEWCSLDFMNYVSGREFVQVEVPEIIVDEFKMHDWSNLNLAEQLVFDESTVYICSY